MIVKQRLVVLLAGTVLGGSLLMTAPVLADDTQTQNLQAEVNAMQQQLQTMQNELSQVRQQASAAQHAVENIPSGLYNAAPRGIPMATKGPSFFDTVHISLAGSFIAMEGARRQHNEVSSGASDLPFGSIPLQNSPLYYENELRFSAQQSRITMEAKGDIDPAQHLLGHYEMDFLGAATTANSRESNSYTPRFRQVFFQYDNDNYHFHFKAGQQWSLLTQERVGMTGAENTPLTIDAQYVAGFNWARQPSIRFVEDWNKTVWFGFSIENPETAFVSNGAAVAQTPNTALVSPPTLAVNPGNTCNNSGLLDNQTMCGNNVAPDLVEKVALDPGWGHYEALALQRWFADDTAPLGGTAWSQNVTFGWGVGGNALFPVVPKLLDLQGSILYGQGIGRYGSSQLADVTVGSNGALQPLTALHFLVGAVAHPFAGNDIYAYYGQEQVQSNFWTIGATAGGYGNPAYPMAGCATPPAAANGTGFGTNGSSATCTANVQRTQEFTVGFWQDAYKGEVGRVRFGLQYEYVRLNLFAGAGSAAGGLSPNNNIVFLSLRYYPFN